MLQTESSIILTSLSILSLLFFQLVRTNRFQVGEFFFNSREHRFNKLNIANDACPSRFVKAVKDYEPDTSVRNHMANVH